MQKDTKYLVRDIVLFYKEVVGCQCAGCSWHTGKCPVGTGSDTSLLDFHHLKKKQQPPGKHRRAFYPASLRAKG